MQRSPQQDLSIDQVAGIVYAATDAYNVAVDDAEPRPRWLDLDEGMQAKVIEAVVAIRDTEAANVEHNHELWCEQMEAAGWHHGPTLDYETKEHPNLVPYEDLPLPSRRMLLALLTATVILTSPEQEVFGDVKQGAH